MSVYRRKDRGGHWWYRRVVKLPDGSKVRIRGPAPINTKGAAENAERAHVERVLNPRPEPPALAPLFRDFAATFMESYVTAAGNKPSEVANKRRILKKHLTPALGHLRLDKIDRAEIDALKSNLLAPPKEGGKGGRSRKTANNVVAVLSTMLEYAIDLGKIDRKPKMGMFKIREQPFRFLDVAEYLALLKAAEPEPMWLAAVLLGGDAGLRRGEIRAMERRHVHMGVGRLSVEQALWENTMGTPKGGKPRTIPMTRRLQDALKRARHLRGAYVLADDDGEFLSLEAMRWNLPRLCRRAGIEEITWHVLRHTFCSHLAMRGAPVRTIMELAGHEDLATTLRYMHLSPGATDTAIALLDQPWPHRGPGQVTETEKPRNA